MTVVRRLAPDRGEVELEQVLDALRAQPPLEPFGELVLDACDAIARELFRAPGVRSYPDVLALATWLRRSNVTRLADESRSLGVRMPRGLAFHVPPANVDVIAMYSLALSVVSGNQNIVRLSSRAGAAGRMICDALCAALEHRRFAALRAGTAVLTWDRGSPATSVCSSVCDVRLLWGGDDTVRTLRELPLRPGATDLGFVDRFSLAAINASAWLAEADGARTELVRRLYNDAYWFDQLACSSPRLLVWCGGDEEARVASADLFSRLADEIRRRGYELPLGAVADKVAWIAGAAIDRPLVRVRRWRNELTVLTLDSLENFSRAHCGAGTFLEVRLTALPDLARYVAAQDQTLVTHGFTRDELECFVARAGGRGVDRVVALGEALSFDHRWDGMNLLSELTRQVVISPAAQEQGLRRGQATVPG